MTAALVGTGSLARLVLRRDRWLLPAWVLSFSAFVAGTGASFAAAYPTPRAQEVFVQEVVANPAIAAVIGPVLGPGIGGLVAWRTGTAGSVIIAVIAVLAVVRHTRADEVEGRQELARSAAVGRHAHVAAAVVVVAAAMTVTGALIGVSLAAQGLPVAGSLALGLSFSAVGWVFVGVAALAAEVCSTGRSATTVGIVVLAVAVVLRMGADVAATGGATSGQDAGWATSLVWVTPTGWMQQVLPFSGPRRWLFGVFVLVTGLLLAAAVALRERRDIGVGLLAPRPGPAHAGRTLGSAFGLAWRRNRGVLLGVVIASALLGLLMGSVAPAAAQAGTQLGPYLARLGVADSGQAFVVLLIYVFAELLAAYAIATTLRNRADEASGLASVLLAAPVGRFRWASSALVIVVLGTTAAMLALGVAIGLAGGDPAGQLPAATGAAMAKLPAIWVMAAVAALLSGIAPRIAVPGSWAVFVLVLVLELGWELGAVSDILFSVSPFSWVYPLGGQVQLSAVVGLTVVAVAMAAVGTSTLRRRDIG